MKKILAIVLVTVFYIVCCWFMDVRKNFIVMSASGKSYSIEYYIIYEVYQFYVEGTYEYSRRVINFDRIYVLLLSLLWFSKKTIFRKTA